ncbi:MAG: helix-turn-helix transcriptional regulator [Nitrospirae bacterium]|nr:helix-turn-helix transcriptional regulator [Nitrospirota bacterium]
MRIGARIKNLRSSQRITLKELAKRADLSISFVSQVEREKTSPSLDSLSKIGSALGVSLAHLFSQRQIKEIIFIKKKKKKMPFYFSVFNEALGIKMKPLILDLKEKDVIFEGKGRGEEFGYVIKGEIELETKGEKVILNEGDSVYLINPLRHKLENLSNKNSVVIWVMTGK